jgi:hypothetical protein
VVPVGQELLTGAPVLDADDAGLRQLAHRTVDRINRAAKATGKGLSRRHSATGAVPVAKQERVQPEGPIGDGCVDHPLGHDRKPWLLDDKGAGGVLGLWRWGFSGHDVAFPTDAVRWAWLNRPLARKGQARQECVRKCAGTARTGRFQRPNRHVRKA